MNNAYYNYIADKYDVAMKRCMTLYTMARLWSKSEEMKQKLEDTLNSLPVNEVLAYDEMLLSIW